MQTSRPVRPMLRESPLKALPPQLTVGREMICMDNDYGSTIHLATGAFLAATGKNLGFNFEARAGKNSEISGRVTPHSDRQTFSCIVGN